MKVRSVYRLDASMSKLKTGMSGRHRSKGRYRSNRPVRSHEDSGEQALRFFSAHVGSLQVGGEGFAWGHCPFHDDRNPSFCVNLMTGWYECKSSACGASGRGSVSFVARLYGFTVEEARQYLEDWS